MSMPETSMDENHTSSVPARQYPACRATIFYEVDMGFQATEASGAPPALEPNDVAARAPLERFSVGQSDPKTFFLFMIPGKTVNHI